MARHPRIDFKKLSADGIDLETLVRDVMVALGYRADWSGKGADGGRDLTALEPGSPDFGAYPRRWLVSCKDFANSGKAVGFAEVANVQDRLHRHHCQGFLLVTTTHPSSDLQDAFDSMRDATAFEYHYWDAPYLTQLLLRPAVVEAGMLDVYFALEGGEQEPKDGGAGGCKGAAGINLVAGYVVSEPTIEPLVHYIRGDGFAFYWETRGREFPDDDGGAHMDTFQLAIDHLSAELPRELSFALRGVWYDDKNGNYHFYVDVASNADYLEPDASALSALAEGVLCYPGEDGGPYAFFEFRVVSSEALNPITERLADESDMTIFDSWPPQRRSAS